MQANGWFIPESGVRALRGLQRYSRGNGDYPGERYEAHFDSGPSRANSHWTTCPLGTVTRERRGVVRYNTSLGNGPAFASVAQRVGPELTIVLNDRGLDTA
jgi:hypothetical protein